MDVGTQQTGAAVQAPACWAPFSSMHLDPRGLVRACCQNHWQPLGRIGEASLLDIWRGTAVRALRRRLEDRDLTLGCELCAVEIDIGAERSAHLHQFDDLPATEPDPPWPRQLELTLSIACNLQCVMCNGELSSSIRIHREGRPALPSVYDDAFFADLDLFLPRLERITLLGGEPFLGAESLRVLDRLIELGLRPTCHINTNGTQWTDRVQRIFRELPLHVAVSVDGRTAETVERIRVGVDHAQLVRNVHEMRAACQRHGSGFSLTFCLMPGNYHELHQVLLWGDELDCDVFVNTVTNPPAHSLHHTSPEEIGAVVEVMERLDPQASAQLGRNRPRWDAALHQIRSLAARREADGSGAPGNVDPLAVARRLARDHAAGGPTVEMRVDDRLLITALGPDPSDAFGVDVRDLVGSPSISFMQRVWPQIGDLDATTLAFAAAGVERRTFSFRTRQGTRVLVAAMARRPGGETWFLALGPPLGTSREQPVQILDR